METGSVAALAAVAGGSVRAASPTSAATMPAGYQSGRESAVRLYHPAAPYTAGERKGGSSCVMPTGRLPSWAPRSKPRSGRSTGCTSRCCRFFVAQANRLALTPSNRVDEGLHRVSSEASIVGPFA